MHIIYNQVSSGWTVEDYYDSRAGLTGIRFISPDEPYMFTAAVGDA
ncbi:MAG TPA: hypothetical protein VJ729_08315 [Nitrososphaeraceae archaeon]|nr:hypothetical protein [Nitrososphaeraceae archaeon]